MTLIWQPGGRGRTASICCWKSLKMKVTMVTVLLCAAVGPQLMSAASLGKDYGPRENLNTHQETRRKRQESFTERTEILTLLDLIKEILDTIEEATGTSSAINKFYLIGKKRDDLGDTEEENGDEEEGGKEEQGEVASPEQALDDGGKDSSFHDSVLAKSDSLP